MAGILDFDARKLDTILEEYGIKQAWVNILATRISKNKKFHYILKNNNFKNHTILDNDILTELTIGEIGVLYEYSVAKTDFKSRKDNGQFFTPDDVAELMASYSKKFSNGKWLDPCSGIGNLSWHLTNYQKNKEEFLQNNLILSDRDSLALFIARVLFTLSFQDKNDNLFNDIESNFIVFDFLSVADNGELTLFGTGGLEKIPEHDFVIVNPPYLAIKGKDTRFETSKCCDLYAYFLENIIKSSKGFISITPQSFTNAAKFYSLRKLLLDKFKNLTIYNFDNIPGNIFHGVKFGSKNSNKSNSIRSSIMIALLEPGIHRITSLLRWRTEERQKLFKNLDLFLSTVKLTPEYFPKVNKVFEPVFNEVIKNKTLGSVISPRPTDYPLHIPSSPRYFISALKEPVKRASIKTIYFYNNKDREFAYLLINSSFMYWWWRVRDGGMTLSLQTIKSLPLVDFEPDSSLIDTFEKSEKENRIYKMNAGSIQENVKHPLNIVKKINLMVFPQHGDAFLSIHQNSEFEQLEYAR